MKEALHGDLSSQGWVSQDSSQHHIWVWGASLGHFTLSSLTSPGGIEEQLRRKAVHEAESYKNVSCFRYVKINTCIYCKQKTLSSEEKDLGVPMATSRQPALTAQKPTGIRGALKGSRSAG